YSAAARARAAYHLDPGMLHEDTIAALRDARRSRPHGGNFGSRRLILSHALDEARLASLTPDQAMHEYSRVGTKVRTLAEIRAEFQANRGNEKFLSIMNR